MCIRDRTYTSWFTESHFTDLPGLTARLREKADPLSKYLYENLSAETQKLVDGKTDDKAVRSALAKDLNRLLERELTNKELLREKSAEKYSIDQELAGGS